MLQSTMATVNKNNNSSSTSGSNAESSNPSAGAGSANPKHSNSGSVNTSASRGSFSNPGFRHSRNFSISSLFPGLNTEGREDSLSFLPLLNENSRNNSLMNYNNPDLNFSFSLNNGSVGNYANNYNNYEQSKNNGPNSNVNSPLQNVPLSQNRKLSVAEPLVNHPQGSNNYSDRHNGPVFNTEVFLNQGLSASPATGVSGSSGGSHSRTSSFNNLFNYPSDPAGTSPQGYYQRPSVGSFSFNSLGRRNSFLPSLAMSEITSDFDNFVKRDSVVKGLNNDFQFMLPGSRNSSETLKNLPNNNSTSNNGKIEDIMENPNEFDNKKLFAIEEKEASKSSGHKRKSSSSSSSSDKSKKKHKKSNSLKTEDGTLYNQQQKQQLPLISSTLSQHQQQQAAQQQARKISGAYGNLPPPTVGLANQYYPPGALPPQSLTVRPDAQVNYRKDTITPQRQKALKTPPVIHSAAGSLITPTSDKLSYTTPRAYENSKTSPEPKIQEIDLRRASEQEELKQHPEAQLVPAKSVSHFEDGKPVLGATKIDQLMLVIQARAKGVKKPISQGPDGSILSDGDVIPPPIELVGGIDKIKSRTTSKKKHQCKYCFKHFTQSTHLEVHLRSHIGLKPYKCEHCGKSFTQGGNLRTHLRSHTGERPFRCNNCGRSFSRKGNLAAHEMTHSNVKPFKCKLDNCDKGFTQLGNLKAHQNRFHLSTVLDLTNKLAGLGDDLSHLPEKERETIKYFMNIYKNSNKGIKGRGKKEKTPITSAQHQQQQALQNASNIAQPQQQQVQQAPQQSSVQMMQNQQPFPYQNNARGQIPLLPAPQYSNKNGSAANNLDYYNLLNMGYRMNLAPDALRYNNNGSASQ